MGIISYEYYISNSTNQEVFFFSVSRHLTGNGEGNAVVWLTLGKRVKIVENTSFKAMFKKSKWLTIYFLSLSSSVFYNFLSEISKVSMCI